MTRQIDTDAVINAVRLADQAGDPANPAAGYKLIYAKAGGFYLINSSGTVIGPIKTVATDTIWDAAGDIVQGTGADTAGRLAIGTANQLLRVNSGATALEYASLGRVLISEQTPTGTGTLSWASIPATYKSLEIEYVGRGTQAANSTNMSLFFNNDTTATNYQRFITGGTGTNTAVNSGADDAVIGAISAASATAGAAGYGLIKINNYASTTFWKAAICALDIVTAATVAATRYSVNLTWENTGAINRVDFTLAANNFDTGTTFRLYGVY